MHSGKTIAVFDLDKTITKSDTYVPFLLRILLHNPRRVLVLPKLSFAVARYMLGLRDNSWLKEEFLRGLASNMRRSEIADMGEKFVQKLLGGGLILDALARIEHHRQCGHVLILATASVDLYAKLIGKRLGFDTVVCTLTEWSDDDRLTGNLASQNCYGPRKKERIANILQEFGVFDELVVYSDHHSDLPLMELADAAVSVNPTRTLRKVSEENQFTIQLWR